MFDGDYDLYTISHTVILIITLVVILGLFFGCYNLAKDMMDSSMEELNEVIETHEQSTTSIETAETIIQPENNVTAENIQIEADKVINTDTYIDNSQSIINEAQRTSYVLPITLAIIFAFIIIIFERWLKHKKEKDERTERILNTPLQTYEQTEADVLKDKYKGTE